MEVFENKVDGKKITIEGFHVCWNVLIFFQKKPNMVFGFIVTELCLSVF